MLGSFVCRELRFGSAGIVPSHHFVGVLGINRTDTERLYEQENNRGLGELACASHLVWEQRPSPEVHNTRIRIPNHPNKRMGMYRRMTLGNRIFV